MKELFNDLLNPVKFRIKPNQFLFRTGDTIHFLYYVKEGHVKLERYTEEGKQVITSFYPKNTYVATASLYNTKYHCQAISTEESKLLKYEKSKILKVFEEQPNLIIEYSTLLAKEIVSLRQQLEFINILDAEERILSFIKARNRDKVYKIPGSLKNLASQVGLTYETLYRKLKSLESKGVIKRQHGNILLK